MGRPRGSKNVESKNKIEKIINDDVNIDEIIDEDVINKDEQTLDEDVINKDEQSVEEVEYRKRNMVKEVAKQLDEIMTHKYDRPLITANPPAEWSKQEQVNEFLRDNTDVREDVMEYFELFNQIFISTPEIQMSLFDFNIKFTYFLLCRNIVISEINHKLLQKFVRYQGSMDVGHCAAEMGFTKEN